MREKNIIKLRIAYMVDDNFNMLFILLLWVLKYKTAFWILLGLTILCSFARTYKISELEKDLNK